MVTFSKISLRHSGSCPSRSGGSGTFLTGKQRIDDHSPSISLSPRFTWSLCETAFLELRPCHLQQENKIRHSMNINVATPLMVQTNTY